MSTIEECLPSTKYILDFQKNSLDPGIEIKLEVLIPAEYRRDEKLHGLMLDHNCPIDKIIRSQGFLKPNRIIYEGSSDEFGDYSLILNVRGSEFWETQKTYISLKISKGDAETGKLTGLIEVVKEYVDSYGRK
ncbi:TPA: hypothetical protein HA239_00695 [Candidatus Woesearchaeota archaeon]|nr:hypothetical protein QT06_C0001G0179 [archaeon GW2011_AR15]MBS3104018.1 hypothetical protein [Candidatus Woesearchaeota archaeon]HIH40915.1 hypothetical protein [Candidatus Woesearchaeota archaeon]